MKCANRALKSVVLPPIGDQPTFKFYFIMFLFVKILLVRVIFYCHKCLTGKHNAKLIIKYQKVSKFMHDRIISLWIDLHAEYPLHVLHLQHIVHTSTI